MRKKRSSVEKNNDALLFWQYLGPAIYYIVGIILVGGLFAAGFAIKGTIDRHNEHVAAEKQQDLTTQRQEIVDKYIENNPNTFGTVTIAFEGMEVTKIFVENKAGQIVTLYERTE